MSRINRKTDPALTTLEQVEAAVGAVAEATHRRDELKAQMEQELVAIRARYADGIDALDMQIAAQVDNLHDWAKRNRAEAFSASKTIMLTHGAIGFRTGNPILSLMRGKTWLDVVNNLAILRMGRYIREVLEPNKERILAEADKIGHEQLLAIGCQVKQVERFFVEPKVDQKGVAA